MNTSSWLGSLVLTGALLASLGACDEAVVGSEDDQVGPSSTIALCQDLGHEICQKACDCGDGGACIVATGSSDAPSAIIYDDLAQCENNFVTFACLNPPNARSYYEDCLGTLTSCVERVVEAGPAQAADLPLACQNPNGFGIVCGDAHCTRLPLESPSNQVCCVAIDGDTSTSSCQAPELSCDGPSLGMSVACDGPEDCGGSSCCGNLTAGIACTTDSSCSVGVGQYCHNSADCPANFVCIPASIAGFDLKVCANP